jgi:hypothetical protein
MQTERGVFGQGWNELSKAGRDAVTADAEAILRAPDDADERACEDLADACVLLRRRIGGPVNLKPYAASLLAGIARRERVQS